MPSKKKQGFASLSPEKLKEVSIKAGKSKSSKKGFGSLSPERRREISQEAARVRWNKVKEEAVEDSEEE